MECRFCGHFGFSTHPAVLALTQICEGREKMESAPRPAVVRGTVGTAMSASHLRLSGFRLCGKGFPCSFETLISFSVKGKKG